MDLTYTITAINSWNRLAIATRSPVGISRNRESGNNPPGAFTTWTPTNNTPAPSDCTNYTAVDMNLFGLPYRVIHCTWHADARAMD